MTDEELKAIEQRAEKALEGPWIIGELDDSTDLVDIWAAEGTQPQDQRGRGRACVGGVYAEPNLRFIAHAREDVPALIAEVRRLRSAGTAEGAEVRVLHSAAGVAAALNRLSPKERAQIFEHVTFCLRCFDDLGADGRCYCDRDD